MNRRHRWIGFAFVALLGLIASVTSTDAQTRCPGLKAPNGKCANQEAVEDAQVRAMVVSTARLSYFGTPIGTVGGSFIPFERLFRDDPLVFGLPTYTVIFRDNFFTPARGTVFRTK